jgi:hypothetical protein
MFEFVMSWNISLPDCIRKLRYQWTAKWGDLLCSHSLLLGTMCNMGYIFVGYAMKCLSSIFRKTGSKMVWNVPQILWGLKEILLNGSAQSWSWLWGVSYVRELLKLLGNYLVLARWLWLLKTWHNIFHVYVPLFALLVCEIKKTVKTGSWLLNSGVFTTDPCQAVWECNFLTGQLLSRYLTAGIKTTEGWSFGSFVLSELWISLVYVIEIMQWI